MEKSNEVKGDTSQCINGAEHLERDVNISTSACPPLLRLQQHGLHFSTLASPDRKPRRTILLRRLLSCFGHLLRSPSRISIDHPDSANRAPRLRRSNSRSDQTTATSRFEISEPPS